MQNKYEIVTNIITVLSIEYTYVLTKNENRVIVSIGIKSKDMLLGVGEVHERYSRRD